MAKSLFIFFFLFLFLWTYNYKVECGKVSHDFVTMVWRMVTDVTSQVTVTRCHMTRVTWGPWENKRIAIVVKCISSREMSENSIEFSLSNSEQRDSWLNSSHQTLDADIGCIATCSHISKPKASQYGVDFILFISCGVARQSSMESKILGGRGVNSEMQWDILNLLSMYWA